MERRGCSIAPLGKSHRGGGEGVVVESHDDFPGVEISIAGGVGEMVRANYCDLFLFFLFFYLILNFVRQAKQLTRYKRPVHPGVWSQTTSGNSPSLIPLAKNPLTLPDTVGTNELSGAVGRKLQEKIQA